MEISMKSYMGIVKLIIVKKLEVDLTMSSQLRMHSGFILVQAVAHLLLPWFRVTSLSQSSFLELG